MHLFIIFSKRAYFKVVYKKTIENMMTFFYTFISSYNFHVYFMSIFRTLIYIMYVKCEKSTLNNI